MAWRGNPHDDFDSDSEEETFPEDAQRLAREAQARRSRWEAHFEARRALIAQVEWQPAPPNLDPTAREGVRFGPDGQRVPANFKDYVMDYADRLKRPGVRTDQTPNNGRARTTTSTSIRVATIDDDAEFAATRSSGRVGIGIHPSANVDEPRRFAWTPAEDDRYWRRRWTRRYRRRGDDTRVRSEIGPRLASYMHAKTAKVVDSTAFMYKSAMESPGFGSADGFPGYTKDLPSDLWPFYEMELRCDPRRLEPAAWRVDIRAKREPEQTIETSALCVCRPVTRFRTFRGDDNDSGMLAGWRPTVSFPDSGTAPAYVILTALRERVLDSDGNEVADTRRVVDDYVVVDENYELIYDLLDQEAQALGGPGAYLRSPSFFNPFPYNDYPWDTAVVLNGSPLTLEGDCFRNWKQLSRAVRSVGPALADARLRAAERVYAPGAEGEEDARANFERLAREQEREKQRRRDREARQEEGKSPRRASGTLPSLAALRV